MRTLKEILDTPIEGAIPASADNSPLLLLGAVVRIVYLFSGSSPQETKRFAQLYPLLCELEALANAPAPDVNAALMANEECQELLAEVKAQNAELRGFFAKASQRRELTEQEKTWAQELEPERQLVQFSCTDCHWVTTTFLQAPKCYRCNRADTLVPFHSQKMPELTAREEMERETA